MRRRLGALALVWGAMGATIAACGDDDLAPVVNVPDAAIIEAGPAPVVDGSIPTPPRIAASDLVLYTGMTATLDASGTVAGAFQWTVKSAPPGSTVATATLAGASSTKPAFRADVSGDYVLEVTATIGTASATKEVRVRAVPAPLFYMQTSFASTPAHYEYRTVGADGTGAHPIACRVDGTPGSPAGDDQVLLGISASLADVGIDWWEAPPGTPSRVAFALFEFDDAGAPLSTIGLGTNASTCDAPAVRVRAVPEDGGTVDTEQGLVQPRFSRNGARVAYLEARASGWFLATVGADGTGRRDLSRLCPDGVGTEGCFAPAILPPRPQWRDNQTVAWVRSNGAGWEVMIADDSANPMPRVYMTCDGSTPRSIAILSDGKVLANREAPDAGREDLWLLEPATPGGACTVIRNLTNLPTESSYARDFSVSPDESQVAFIRRKEVADAGPPQAGVARFGGQIYTVPMSGAAPPAPVTGSAQETLFGPRYVAGASMLAWGGVIPGAGTDALLIDGGLPIIAVAPVDGGPVTHAVRSNADAGLYVMGGGSGGSCDFRFCSIGRTRSSGGGALAFAALGGALLVRRRRRLSAEGASR